LHKFGTLIATVLVEHFQSIHRLLVIVDTSTLLNKFFGFVLTHVVLTAVPHEHIVILAHLITWFSFSTKYKQNFLIFEVFKVENSRWFLPIRILE
jgi:hypothetical protein